MSSRRSCWVSTTLPVPASRADDAVRERIAAVNGPVDVKVIVSLSCTMCPETVVAAQRIAAENENVRAEVYDIAHAPGLEGSL